MITKSIKDMIKEYFLQNPTEKLRVRQIERFLKIPIPSAIRYSKELEKEGILKKTIVSGAVFYSADRSSKKFIIEKKIYNFKSLYDSGMVEHIIKQCSDPAIIVFGSYSKGEDVEESDIDLYIESSEKIDMSSFEKKLGRKIQVFQHKSIKNIENKKLANNIINGIILNGFVEVFS